MSDIGETPAAQSRWRTGSVGVGDLGTVRLAGPGIRSAARILDVGVVYTLWLITRDVVSTYVVGSRVESVAGRLFVALAVLTLVFVGYEIVQTALWGQTVGKRIVDIRVVNESTGRPPGWGRSLIRWAVPLVPFALLAVFLPLAGEVLTLLAAVVSVASCYLSITWDRKNQGWHDKAAGTFVVKTGVLVSER
ncbi:MAG: RDD family protein [Acidimicrobiaceae bacterium]|nr:RDD family protein [Acidimicrobiaceae bacterium]